jgi:hypothetical protein
MHERLAVYVPDPDASPEAARTVTHIDRGSGIVGKRVVDADPDESPLLVYYEGNRFDAEGLRLYAERVMHAAGRMTENAPTIAKSLVRPDALLHVGWWYPQERRVQCVGDDDSPMPGRALFQLAAWIGLPLDGAPERVSVTKLGAELRCPPRPMSGQQARDYMRKAARGGVTGEQALEFEQAHVEGLHDEVPREFCPICESQGRRA